MIDYALIIVLLLVLFPFVFYPFLLFILWCFYKAMPSKVGRHKDLLRPQAEVQKDFCLVITCYNEERTIGNKIENIISVWNNDSELKLIILDDGSTDKTAEIANSFNYPHNIHLSVFKLERLGKTASQNWFFQESNFEIYLFTDANAEFDENTLNLLLAQFDDKSVGYCSANLVLKSTNMFGQIENIYWEYDKWLRKLESDIASCVGGNGALYGIRRTAYSMLPPLLSHDGFMPAEVVTKGFKATFCENSRCFEKAAKQPRLEFMRRVRMNRGLPLKYFYNFQKFNFFRVGWFAFFYFGHKFTKVTLFLTHTILVMLSILAFSENQIADLVVLSHLGLLFLLFTGMIVRNKMSGLIRSYFIAFAAQWVATFKTFFGRTNAIWDRTSER